MAIFTHERELELGTTEKQIQLVVVSRAGPEHGPDGLLLRRAEKSVTLPLVDITTCPWPPCDVQSLNFLRYSFRVLILSLFGVVLQQIWWFQSFPWSALTRGLEISSVSRCLDIGHRNTRGNWRSLLASSCANKLLPARRESNYVFIMVVLIKYVEYDGPGGYSDSLLLTDSKWFVIFDLTADKASIVMVICQLNLFWNSAQSLSPFIAVDIS